MKRRLLIITNLYPTPWDHQRGTFNFQQFNHLAEHLDIRIIVPVSWKERLLARGSGTPLPAHPLQNRACYPWYWYTPGMLRGSYARTLQLSLEWQCRKLIRHFQPDMLLSTWAYPEGATGTRLAQNLGIPAFVKVHGSDINIIAQHPAVRRQILSWSRQVAGIASVSADLKTKMEKMGMPGSRIHVIYNGIDHQRFHTLPAHSARKQLALDDAPMILYVGNLKKEKGCLDLLQAFIRLAPQHPALKLYLAGTGAMEATLRQWASQAGLQNRVILLGSIAHADLIHWYNAAELVCLPSYNEGVPNVLLEAMACGTPVVATRVGGIPEVVNEDDGLLLDAGNTDMLADCLDQALARNWNPQHIQHHARKFSWNENTRQMLDMFANAEGPTP